MVIVIDEVILELRRVDWGETTSPHECRRSGLNDGTMRKCRIDAPVDVFGVERLSPNDIECERLEQLQ